MASCGLLLEETPSILSQTFPSHLVGLLSMPIAFKEWAVTVRALAEGEQLLTLRKGGCREPTSPSSSPTSASSCTPRSTTSPVTSCASPTSPSCAARSRRASGATASRRCTASSRGPRCSSPTACASAPGRKSPTTSRSSTPAASTRSRRSTCGRPTTPKSASAGAVASRCTCCCCAPTASRGRSRSRSRTSTRAPNAWIELQRELPFEGTPVLSDAEFERASEEIRSITSRSRPARPGLARLAASRQLSSASRAAWAPDSGTSTSRGPIDRRVAADRVAQQARDALLEQQAGDELGLRLAVGARRPSRAGPRRTGA